MKLTSLLPPLLLLLLRTGEPVLVSSLRNAPTQTYQSDQRFQLGKTKGHFKPPQDDQV